MSFSSVHGQAEALAFLQEAMRRGRIPSAYLFLGPHHVGKRTAALTLAKALNCAVAQDDSCDRCPSCRKIDEDVHPDVETVRPDGQFIKIGQVREVGEHLGLIPFEARKRVVILARAERMNPQAANAFLKTLEEPPHDTLIVLCANQAARLPETIVSRCVPVRFRLLPTQTTRELLEKAGDLDADTLDFAVRFAQGRLRPELLGKAAHWMKLRDDMIHCLTELQRPIFPQLSESVARWSASEDWRFVLEWLETWFRDLALLGAGAPEARLINGDRLDPLRTCGRWFTSERAEHCHEQVLATRDALLINANKTLALEALWLGFKHATL